MTPPTNWRFGVVGNIVKEHIDKNGNIYSGTKEFTGGTKVFLDWKYWSFDSGCNINVIGLNRFKHYKYTSIEPSLIENVRVQVIYNPSILEIFEFQEEFEGGDVWGRTTADKRNAKAFVERWNSTQQTLQ